MNKVILSISALIAMSMAGSVLAQSMGGSNRQIDLPPPGESVSLDKYDEYYQGLKSEIDDRMKQLSPPGSDGSTSLEGPNVDEYKGDLDQLSRNQREMKVLQSMLEKAKIAKELWAEVHSDPRAQYESQIQNLEQRMQEMRVASSQQTEELAAENETLRESLAEATQTLQRNEMASYRENQRFSGIAQGDPRSSFPAYKVSRVWSISGRQNAMISMSDGREMRVSKGDTLPNGSVISKITDDGVSISMDGKEISLPRGSFNTRNRSPSSNQNVDPFSSDMPSNYLDNAARMANP